MSGYINKSTGEFVTYSLGRLWMSTDYIPINKGDTIVVYSAGSDSVDIAYYKADKTVLSIVAGTSPSLKTFTAPDGARYYRCSNYTGQSSDRVQKPYTYSTINIYEKVVEALNKELVIGNDSIRPQQITSIAPPVDEETTATITTALEGEYYTQTGTTISKTSYTGLGSMVIENIEVGKSYYLKIGQEVGTNMYGNYFIFAKSTTEAVIKHSNIANYVRLIDNDNHIYLITIPEGCTRVYTAGYVRTFPTFWVKGLQYKSLDWLIVNKGNLASSLVNEITSNVLAEVKKHTLFDSINKPITFNGKTLVVFGDSITWGVASPNLQNAGENKYISLFAAHVGATLNNKAKSGACITDGQNNIESIHTTLTSFTGSADIILIAGGVNDWQTQASIGNYTDSVTTTLYGALNDMCSYIKTNYPNAVVIFVTPLPTTSTTTFGNTHPDNLSDYRAAIQEVAAANGFNVVNGADLGLPDKQTAFGNAMFDPTDCVHPTLAGHAMYARSLAGKLM